MEALDRQDPRVRSVMMEELGPQDRREALDRQAPQGAMETMVRTEHS